MLLHSFFAVTKWVEFFCYFFVSRQKSKRSVQRIDWVLRTKYIILKKKITAFKTETKTKKAVYFTMLTSFGIEKNSYATSLVQNEMVMDDWFA
jgi:hypothetical protein